MNKEFSGLLNIDKSEPEIESGNGRTPGFM